MILTVDRRLPTRQNPTPSKSNQRQDRIFTGPFTKTSDTTHGVFCLQLMMVIRVITIGINQSFEGDYQFSKRVETKNNSSLVFFLSKGNFEYLQCNTQMLWFYHS